MRTNKKTNKAIDTIIAISIIILIVGKIVITSAA